MTQLTNEPQLVKNLSQETSLCFLYGAQKKIAMHEKMFWGWVKRRCHPKPVSSELKEAERN